MWLLVVSLMTRILKPILHNIVNIYEIQIPTQVVIGGGLSFT